MAVPNVTIEGGVWGEWEYKALADALGLAMPADAIGRMASLWQWCLSKETDIAPAKVVDAHLGKGGAAAVIECDLGEPAEGGIRIRGAAKRVSQYQDWLGGKAKGGRARADTAKRASGRFGNEDDKPTSRAPADDQQPPAALQQEPAGHQLSVSVSLSGSEKTLPDASPSGDGDWAGQSVVRRRMAQEGLRRLNEIRRAVAADLGLGAVIDQPVFAADELPFRLRDAGSEKAAALQLHHALACLEAEARASRTVQWLTGAAFEHRSWRRLLGMTAADAARPKAKPAQPWQGRAANAEAPPRKLKRLVP